MDNKNICFLYITINNNEHHISMDINVEKKKLYCYERLTSVEYELGSMDNNEYKINKKSKQILIKPRCVKFKLNHELALEKGIDPEKVLNKLLTNLKNINIIICNNARFTINSILAEAIKYNIQFDFNKFLIIDIDSDIKNVSLLKTTFFTLLDNKKE